MDDPFFHRASRPLSLAAVAAHATVALPAEADPTTLVTAVATLGSARAGELAVAFDESMLEDLRTTRAGACFVAPRHRDSVPAATLPLVTDDPLRAFLAVAALIDPSTRGAVDGCGEAFPRGAAVHPEARLEPGASVGPGAVVGPGAEIGAGTTIGANSVVAADVRIGRACAIGPLVTLSHALLGDEVVVHAGARIGVAGAGGARLGRAIIQNRVEIGANAVVVRGAMRDTVIGEGAVVDVSAIIASDTVVPRFATVGAALGRRYGDNVPSPLKMV